MRVMLRLLQHAPQSRQAGAQPADPPGRNEENDDEQTQSGESQLQVFEDGAGEQVGAQLLVGGRAEHRPQEGALPPPPPPPARRPPPPPPAATFAHSAGKSPRIRPIQKRRCAQNSRSRCSPA